MKQIKIAVIGCSAIADKTVIPTILENQNFTLSMVGSRFEEKGKKFAEKFGCGYGSYDDVLNSSNVDAVYVSVPTGLHYYWGKKVLESTKHLLLEKPFTDTISNTRDLIELAQRKHLIAMEGLAYVFHPYMEKLKELLKNSTIGEVRLIESSFGFPNLPLSDIRNNLDIGGGAILDNLIYPLSISLEILDCSIVKKSFHYISDPLLKIDTRGFLRLDGEKTSAHINYGFGFSYKNTIEIWGSEGSIYVDRAFTKPSNVDAEIIIKKNGQVESIVISAANQFHLMLDAFCLKVNGHCSNSMNEGQDIINRMNIISELYLSARNDA